MLEALLFHARAIHKQGRVDDGTNHADFTAQEHAHHHSLEPSVLSLDHQGRHINLIDPPGLPDFFGRTQLVMPAVEGALLLINAARGIESVTQRAFELARQQGKSVMIVINQIDTNPSQLEPLLTEIQEQFGHGCLPLNLPSADGQAVVDCYLQPDFETPTLFADATRCQEALVDVVVEQDEALMNLYLEQDETLTPQQLHAPLEKALRQGELVPVCFTSVERDQGIDLLLDALAQVMPSPLEANPPEFLNGFGEEAQPVVITPDADAHLLAHLFRIVIDPYAGRLGLFRIYQGKVRKGQKLFLGSQRKAVKITHLLKLQGRKQLDIQEGVAGDICAVAKIEGLEVGAILHDNHEEDNFHLPDPELPQPLFALAVQPKRRGDEQKLAEVLNKLVSEDPSLQITHAGSENETVLQGLGEMHLQIALEKAQQVFNLELETHKPSLAYRETITLEAEARYRHKKQTGGAGQFGEVALAISPLEREEGFEFVSEVVGGAIPAPFIPAVKKGVIEAMNEGVLAGYPMQDIRVVLLDGKHHPVDSKEIAFVMAGKKAFIEAAKQAEPALLEPLVKLEVLVPQEKIGDISGDLTSRRGMICGTEVRPNQLVAVLAEAPLAALDDYATRIKGMTAGKGQLSMTFSRYELVPPAELRRLMLCEQMDEDPDEAQDEAAGGFNRASGR
ncbi:elongation factor G [Ferrimonas gelatinilytica]|uniref:Elongation factor G n=1 Tax=Ferrimonas gelatinilytica TaxID=1255257 RepID=A0ABP9S9Z7_9GAMM